MVSIKSAAIDVNRFPGVAGRTISEVERDYRRSHSIVVDDACQSANVAVEVVDDLDDSFTQEELWEGDGGSSFTVDHRLVIVTALAWFSKTALSPGYDFASRSNSLVD